LAGLVDVTAWVDFTAVAESATRAGFEVAGFTTQTAFLLGEAVSRRNSPRHRPTRATNRNRWRSRTGARQLLMPGEMGEAVKFMLLTRDCDIDLPGFAFADLRTRYDAAPRAAASIAASLLRRSFAPMAGPARPVRSAASSATPSAAVLRPRRVRVADQGRVSKPSRPRASHSAGFEQRIEARRTTKRIRRFEEFEQGAGA
jgi:hypothetical protein